MSPTYSDACSGSAASALSMSGIGEAGSAAAALRSAAAASLRLCSSALMLRPATLTSLAAGACAAPDVVAAAASRGRRLDRCLATAPWSAQTRVPSARAQVMTP